MTEAPITPLPEIDALLDTPIARLEPRVFERREYGVLREYHHRAVDFQTEIPRAQQILQAAVTYKSPEAVVRLAERMSRWRTLSKPVVESPYYGRREYGWSLVKELTDPAEKEVLFLLAEGVLALKQMGSAVTSVDLFRAGNLYRRMSKEPLGAWIAGIAYQMKTSAQRPAVPGATLRERWGSVLDVFVALNAVKTMQYPKKEVFPAAFAALFESEYPLEPEFVMGIMKAFNGYLLALPETVPEGKVMAAIFVRSRVKDYIKALEDWFEKNKDTVSEYQEEFDRLQETFNRILNETLYNPRWVAELTKREPKEQGRKR